MFKEKEITAAFEKLFGLFDKEELCSEDDVPFYKRVLPEVCMVLRDRVTTPYQYTVDTNMERGFRYCGAELFGQRACKIYSDMTVGVSDIIDSFYTTELWLLEDMTFVIVRCVTLFTEDSSGRFYESEYRTVVKAVTERDDLFFSPEDLEEDFDELCEDIWEHKATIYEM